MAIEIRPVRPLKDLMALSALELTVWQFSDERAPLFKLKEHLLSLRYALKHILHASAGWCAVMDGKVVGTAFCAYPDSADAHSARHLGLLTRLVLNLVDKLAFWALKLARYSFKYDYAVFERSAQIKSLQVCTERGEVDKSCDGQLLLLMTAKAAQGVGAGRALLTRALQAMEAQGLKRCFLFTDTFCNYRFYDVMGLKRIYQSTEIGIFGPEDGDRCAVDFMVYTAKLS